MLVLIFLFMFTTQAKTATPVGRLAQDCQDAVRKLDHVGKRPSCAMKAETSQTPVPEMVTVAPPPPKPRTENVQTANGLSTAVSVVSEDQLKKMYHLAITMGIPWTNHKLCAQRAHLLGSEFHDDGIEVGKLMVKPKRVMAGLFQGWIRPKFSDGRKENLWDFHVADFVTVEREGKLVQMVIDPATHDHPVTRAEWEEFLDGAKPPMLTNRFAFSPDDADRTDINSYTGDRSIGATRQSIEEHRGN